jgi:glycosyltransferase 2 family protein
VSARVKSALQYLFVISLTTALLWFSLRGISVGEGENKAEFIWHAWQRSDKMYLLLMAVVLFVSHILRAMRWKMLLEPSGNYVTVGNSLLSVLVAYLVNLAVPRGGEVSRCYNLYKLEKTPVEVSFGTVVVERIADVICLLLLIVISFFLEWEKLKTFIDSLNTGSTGGGFQIPAWVYVALLGVIVIGIIFYVLRKNEKFKKLFSGFKEGLLSVFRLKNKWLFLFHSIAIWVLYFIMSYFVVLAFPETSTLGFSAVMTLFAVGAIAMSMPLPGGAGSYHTLVPLALVMLYQMNKADAVAFVFIFHAWQTLIMIVGGVIALGISYWIIRWKNQPIK